MKPRIERAYTIIEQYSRSVDMSADTTVDTTVDTALPMNGSHLLKIVVEGDSVFIQTDPYPDKNGDPVIKRLAELDMIKATKLLMEAAIGIKQV